jgi:hypothetical protein
LLRRQFEGFLTDGQMGVIPSLGTQVPRLLAPVPLGSLGVVLGIIQLIGAIVPWLGFGASSKQIGLELTFFAFEVFDFLPQRGDALQGIVMATLPIPDLLAELEILAIRAMDLSAEIVNFPAQVLHQSNQFFEGGAGANWTGALRKGRSRADGTE